MRAPRILSALLVIFFSGVAAFGCGAAAPGGGATDPPGDVDANDPRDVDALFDRSSRAVFRHAASVTLYRLTSVDDPRGKPLPGGGSLSKFASMRAKTPDADHLEKLLAQILDGGTYRFGVHKRCAFSPGVALRFVDGGEAVSLLICFTCNEMLVTDTKGHETMVSFDPGRDALFSLAEAALGVDLGAPEGPTSPQAPALPEPPFR